MPSRRRVVALSSFALSFVLTTSCDRREAQPAVAASPALEPTRPASSALVEPGFELATGLYRTSVALPGHEDSVRAGQLVLVRTDGEFAPASVLTPASNQHNRWRFDLPGTKLAAGSKWLDSLRALPHEGFYRLTREFRFGTDGKWIVDAIVQLGYTSDAEPILFIAQRRDSLAENDLWFSEQGTKVTLDELDGLIAPLAWYQEPEVGEASTGRSRSTGVAVHP
jgi:hypothetical protein